METEHSEHPTPTCDSCGRPRLRDHLPFRAATYQVIVACQSCGGAFAALSRN